MANPGATLDGGRPVLLTLLAWCQPVGRKVRFIALLPAPSVIDRLLG